MPREPRTIQAEAAAFERSFTAAGDLTGRSWAARRVLAMAAALFYRNGAAATSVRDLTTACDLSPGALYNHFASKDELLYVLVDHGHARMERRIADALSKADDEPLERSAAFIRAYVLGHLEEPRLAQVVRREYLHLSAEHRPKIIARRRRLREQLTRLLLADAERNGIDLIDGTDGAVRAAVMILDLCSRTSDWYDPTRAEPPNDLAERYVKAALRLVGAS